MEENKPKIRCFICKSILYHSFIYVEFPDATPLYADNVKYMVKENVMTVVHGFTKNHVMDRTKKYLKKHKLID